MWPSKVHLNILYRASVSIDDFNAFSSMDTTEIRGNGVGFMCRNGPVRFNAVTRSFNGACFLNAVISMLSFMDNLSSDDIIRLANNTQMIDKWVAMTDTLLARGAPRGSIQAYSIFLMCCAHMNVNTYFTSPVDMGYGDENKLWTHKINIDGSVAVPSTISTYKGISVLVHVHYLNSLNNGWRFIGMFVDMNNTIIGHSIAVRADIQADGTYKFELFDSDEKNTHEFNNFDALLLYIFSYGTKSVYIKYVYMNTGT
jgi:hypothetical protein